MGLEKMLEKLQQQLVPKIDSALSKEVLQAVSDAEGAAIYEEVYRMPTSGRYGRRWDNGGLLDPDNVQGTVTDGTLAVVNVTEPNPYLNGINRHDGLSTTPGSASLADIVEHGVYDPHGAGYDYWTDAKARPFTTKTVENLKKSGAHVAALRKGLQRQGVKLK